MLIARRVSTVTARSAATKQFSWIATACFAHLAITKIQELRAIGMTLLSNLRVSCPGSSLEVDRPDFEGRVGKKEKGRTYFSVPDSCFPDFHMQSGADFPRDTALEHGGEFLLVTGGEGLQAEGGALGLVVFEELELDGFGDVGCFPAPFAD